MRESIRPEESSPIRNPKFLHRTETIAQIVNGAERRNLPFIPLLSMFDPLSDFENPSPSLSTPLLSLFNEIWCERPIILLISIHKRAAGHVDGREPYVAQEQRGKNNIPWSPGDEQDDPAMGNSLSPPASDPRFDLAARQI